MNFKEYTLEQLRDLAYKLSSEQLSRLNTELLIRILIELTKKAK